MTSQPKVHPSLPCFVILELSPAGISALTTGKTLGFARRGVIERPCEARAGGNDFSSGVEPMGWFAREAWLYALQQSSWFTCGWCLQQAPSPQVVYTFL